MYHPVLPIRASYNGVRLFRLNSRDGTPLVHPMWYYYDNGKFFAVSNKDGTKVRSLKKNPDVYFLVDIAERGVRGRGRAKVIDDPEYATKPQFGKVYGISR